MLENSILIDGKEGKELDEYCKKYNETSIQIKDLTKSKDEADKGIKSICNKKGTFESFKFVVSMTEIEDTQKLDVKVTEEFLKEKYPNVWEELCEVALKESKGYIKLVSVKNK